MFSQAAAVFVTLSTLFAPQFPTRSFPFAFRQVGPFAGTPRPRSRGTISCTTIRHAISDVIVILHHVVIIDIGFVVVESVRALQGGIGGPHDTGTFQVPALSIVRRYLRSGSIQGCSYCGGVGTGRCHALASSHTMGGIEGAQGDRVRVMSRCLVTDRKVRRKGRRGGQPMLTLGPDGLVVLTRSISQVQGRNWHENSLWWSTWRTIRLDHHTSIGLSRSFPKRQSKSKGRAGQTAIRQYPRTRIKMQPQMSGWEDDISPQGKAE